MKGTLKKVDGSSHTSLWWMCSLDEIKSNPAIPSGSTTTGVCKHDNSHYKRIMNLITSMWTRSSTAELYNTNLLRNELIWSLPGFHLQWGRKLNLSLGVIKVMLLGLEWSSRHVVCTLHLSVHTSYTYLLSILITTVWKKTYHWGFSFIFFFCFLYNILLKIYKKKCSGHKWKQLLQCN